MNRQSGETATVLLKAILARNAPPCYAQISGRRKKNRAFEGSSKSTTTRKIPQDENVGVDGFGHTGAWICHSQLGTPIAGWSAFHGSLLQGSGSPARTAEYCSFEKVRNRSIPQIPPLVGASISFKALSAQRSIGKDKFLKQTCHCMLATQLRLIVNIRDVTKAKIR